METTLRFDTGSGAAALDLSADRLSQLSNGELLDIVRRLESRGVESRAVEYDHRRYLQRSELERLVRLAARVHGRPRSSVSASSRGDAPASAE